MKDLLRDLRFDLEDLDDVASRIEYINTFDHDDIEEIEAEIEDVLDLLKGHFEEIIKLAKNNNKK